MAKKSRFVVPFPAGGLDRSGAYNQSKPQTTPLALNVWNLDPSTDRYRGGVRPVLKSIGTLGGAPYNWCKATYLDGSTVSQSGIAVAYAGGCRVSLTGADWGTPPEISTTVSTNFASCAVYNKKLILARGGTTALYTTLPADGSTTFVSATDPTNPAPTKCGIVIAHADRLWFMGDTDNIHQIYASAVGDELDWDYSDPTEGGAFTNTGDEGGIIGEPVIAAISHDDNWLLVGSTDSIYGINGNPKLGGIHEVSDNVGPLSNRAWCKGEGPTGSNDTYIMTRAGFGVIRQGSLQFENLSDGPNIRDLKGLNPGTPNSVGNVSGDEVVIGYDGRWKVVHIFVNPSSGSDYGYAYDVRTGAFWPQDFSSTISLIPTLPKLQTAQRSTALPISSGGSLYQFDSAEAQGGGNEDFTSYVLIPVPLASPGEEGIFHTIAAALAKDSDNTAWSIYVGDSAEQAYQKAAADSTNTAADFSGGTWSYSSSQYWNYTVHPRTRGNFAFLKLRDVSGERWLVEEMVAEVVGAGRRRV